MIKEIIHRAGEQGQKEVVIGMAHRGRLNVLVNVLGKNPSELFDEFGGKVDESLKAGDVKYHQGFSSDFRNTGGNVHLALAFNPSHLEIVNPVVMGSVRARLDRRDCDTVQKHYLLLFTVTQRLLVKVLCKKPLTCHKHVHIKLLVVQFVSLLITKLVLQPLKQKMHVLLNIVLTSLKWFRRRFST